VTCPATSPRFYADAGDVSCTAASDCADAGIPFQGCLAGKCSFDACLVDTDCAKGQACACADQFGGNAEHFNECISAQCRVDSDCGEGRACSPSYDDYCGSVVGHYCHTAADSCTTDADCCADPSTPRCLYSQTIGHFACQIQTVCSG
jgi:hypothetical protein